MKLPLADFQNYPFGLPKFCKLKLGEKRKETDGAKKRVKVKFKVVSVLK